ncbi:hypothetical protein PFICI_14243 [Pestalotiopsis fici W106-1]|uniref:Uncharacterized protein n=1 Tax=Pestalotiopsis fici (strain W106-1 / CGMCC3.15140) TaxID=1229662 RepID=W3WMJ9_PESFW|nr:uncharacterized protein PFICI_14243 [Pestalotiopsis fici W106-1]ETS74377.1 hypothetical protein PFICI_14243 [Pestalotiopsis fici W106-1]
MKFYLVLMALAALGNALPAVEGEVQGLKPSGPAPFPSGEPHHHHPHPKPSGPPHEPHGPKPTGKGGPKPTGKPGPKPTGKGGAKPTSHPEPILGLGNGKFHPGKPSGKPSGKPHHGHHPKRKSPKFICTVLFWHQTDHAENAATGKPPGPKPTGKPF